MNVCHRFGARYFTHCKRMFQPLLNFGVRAFGLVGFAARVSFTGAPSGGRRRIHLEHRLATLAQGLALPLHAGGDAHHIGNFRDAKPHRVARTHLLLLRRIGPRSRRHREHEHGCDQPCAAAELRRCQRHLMPPCRATRSLTDPWPDRPGPRTLTVSGFLRPKPEMVSSAGRIVSSRLTVRLRPRGIAPGCATKTPGGWTSEPPGVTLIPSSGRVLEHAEHDGADKGECDIRGDNAQPADERTIRSSGNLPGSRRCPLNAKASRCSRRKSQPCCLSIAPDARTAGNVVKDS